jgi:hypothetical protein
VVLNDPQHVGAFGGTSSPLVEKFQVLQRLTVACRRQMPVQRGGLPGGQLPDRDVDFLQGASAAIFVEIQARFTQAAKVGLVG